MTSPFAPTAPAAAERAEGIRQDAERAYSSIRSMGELTPAAIRSRIAAAYLNAKAQMDAAQAAATGNYEKSRQTALTAAFGINDIATSATDRAGVSMSYRDAQDRADQLETDTDAARLLGRANDTGDELLARAIAQRAWNMNGQLGGAGWGDVLDTFTATRPRAAAAIANLINLQSRNSVSLFAWMIAKPPEIANLSDYQIPAVAEGA